MGHQQSSNTDASKLNFKNPVAITPLTCPLSFSSTLSYFFIYCNYFSNKIFLVIIFIAVQSNNNNNNKIIVKKSYASYLSPWPLLGHGEGWGAGEAVNRKESVFCTVKMYRSIFTRGKKGNEGIKLITHKV